MGLGFGCLLGARVSFLRGLCLLLACLAAPIRADDELTRLQSIAVLLRLDPHEPSLRERITVQLQRLGLESAEIDSMDSIDVRFYLQRLAAIGLDGTSTTLNGAQIPDALSRQLAHVRNEISRLESECKEAGWRDTNDADKLLQRIDEERALVRDWKATPEPCPQPIAQSAERFWSTDPPDFGGTEWKPRFRQATYFLARVSLPSFPQDARKAIALRILYWGRAFALGKELLGAAAPVAIDTALTVISRLADGFLESLRESGATRDWMDVVEAMLSSRGGDHVEIYEFIRQAAYDHPGGRTGAVLKAWLIRLVDHPTALYLLSSDAKVRAMNEFLEALGGAEKATYPGFFATDSTAVRMYLAAAKAPFEERVEAIANVFGYTKPNLANRVWVFAQVEKLGFRWDATRVAAENVHAVIKRLERIGIDGRSPLFDPAEIAPARDARRGRLESLLDGLLKKSIANSWTDESTFELLKAGLASLQSFYAQWSLAPEGNLSETDVEHLLSFWETSLPHLVELRAQPNLTPVDVLPLAREALYVSLRIPWQHLPESRLLSVLLARLQWMQALERVWPLLNESVPSTLRELSEATDFFAGHYLASCHKAGQVAAWEAATTAWIGHKTFAPGTLFPFLQTFAMNRPEPTTREALLRYLRSWVDHPTALYALDSSRKRAEMHRLFRYLKDPSALARFPGLSTHDLDTLSAELEARYVASACIATL